MTHSWSGVRTCAAVALLAVASAQATPVFAQSMFHMVPSFSVTQVYDTNPLFASIRSEADFITRATSGLESRYESPWWTVSTGYSLDAERFMEHPELTAISGQHLSLGITHKPWVRFKYGVDASFTKTRVPADLNLDTGLLLKRARAERSGVHSSGTGQLNSLTTATADYSFGQDHLEGGVRLQSQAASFRIERHVSERDATTFGYSVQRYDFAHATVTTSQVATIDWSREMTRRTTIALRGGPRLTDGRFSPELAAGVTRGLKSGSMSLAYARTTTTLIGAAGTAETQSLTAPITYSGSRWLQLRMSPGVFRIAHSGHQLTAYHFGFEASGRITRTLSAVAAYDVSRQDGNFYSPLAGYAGLSRQSVSIGIARAAAGDRR